MKKYLLRLILVLWACSFYSCSEDPELISPFGEISQPDLNITNSSLSGSTITFAWEAANEYALQFSYRLLMGGATIQDWSDWSTDTEIIFSYLDEGSYQFQVKSRYEVTSEQETPDSYSFNDFSPSE